MKKGELMKITYLIMTAIILSSCGADLTENTVEKNFERAQNNEQESGLKKETNLKDNTKENEKTEEVSEELANFIKVNVSGLRNQFGQICYSISKRVKSFPPKIDDALESDCTPIEGKNTTFIIDNLDMNELHALSIFHDENFNGNLDMKKLIGIAVPKEGFGFSGNPGIKMLGYEFDDCAFNAEQGLTVNIAMKYVKI